MVDSNSETAPSLDRPLPVLFEDGDLIAVNKPAGLLTIPDRSKDPSVRVLLEESLQTKIFVVHRLDKETSGVLLLAKNAAAHKHLNDQFTARAVKKTYMALVHGTFDRGSVHVNKPLREYGSGRVGVDEKVGKPAATAVFLEKNFTRGSFVRAAPLSGRRHQIRVHLYSIGHPVLGDLLYGVLAEQKKFPRLFLHSKEIEFKNLNGEPLLIRSSLPNEFRDMMTLL